MRFICSLKSLKRLKKHLASFTAQINFDLSDDEHLLIAAQMLGHRDFEDFEVSLNELDRTDRLFDIEEGRTSNEDPLHYCHMRALESAGFTFEEASEFTGALLADEHWRQNVHPLPLSYSATSYRAKTARSVTGRYVPFTVRTAEIINLAERRRRSSRGRAYRILDENIELRRLLSMILVRTGNESPLEAITSLS